LRCTSGSAHSRCRRSIAPVVLAGRCLTPILLACVSPVLCAEIPTTGSHHTAPLTPGLLNELSLSDALRASEPSIPLKLQSQANVAAEEDEEEGGMKDNSFLIEEAYNQEPGVAQHIFNWVPAWSWEGGHSRTFDFSFTQEWPIGSQTHQFSYTIPASKLFDHPVGERSTEVEGIGDVMLNYRLQVWTETPDRPAFAPRFSLILPTGNERKGLGSGELGYQINLPWSKELEHWAFHLNAGLTLTPNVKAGVDPSVQFGGSTLNGYNLGGSAIWLARKDLNFMLETVANWDEELQDDGDEDNTIEVRINPGVRWAPYTNGDTQWVLGIGLPIGLSHDSPDISVFFYMSFEHPFKDVPKD
jgi:Putative MetA-pathway of phenol degradation